MASLVLALPVPALAWWDDYVDAVYWVLPNGEHRVNATIHNVVEDYRDVPIGDIKAGWVGWDPSPPPGWYVRTHERRIGYWMAGVPEALVYPGEALSGFVWTTDRLWTYGYSLNGGAAGNFTPTLIPEPPWLFAAAALGLPILGRLRRRRRQGGPAACGGAI